MFVRHRYIKTGFNDNINLYKNAYNNKINRFDTQLASQSNELYSFKWTENS